MLRISFRVPPRWSWSVSGRNGLPDSTTALEAAPMPLSPRRLGGDGDAISCSLGGAGTARWTSYQFS